jgi:TetR/AcrR family transcriptional repressor of nem operon
MTRNTAATRSRLLDAAEELVLARGYSATTVDHILARAGVTKGTFFYHFASKGELALALVRRYAELEQQTFDATMARATRLARSPKEQLLVFVGLLEEATATLEEPSAGCLFASYCYEAELFDEAIHQVIQDALRVRRARIEAKLREVAALHTPRLEVDLASLADAVTASLEGAYVLSRTLKEPRAVSAQLRHHRNYLDLLFES